MATCQCSGGTCVCEAIKTPPSLPFWKKYDRQVHNFVAWTVILNIAMLGALPLAMYAQESTESSPVVQQPPSGEMQPPPEGMMQPPSGEMQPPPEGMMQPPSGEMQPPPEGMTRPPSGEMQRPPEGTGGPRDFDGRNRDSARGQQDGEHGDRQGPQCQIERTKKQIMGALRQFSRIKSRIAQLERKGVKAPQDLTDALAKADEMAQKVQAITSCEEFADLEFEDAMHEIGSTIQERLGVMERLANLTKVYKNIDRRLKNFDKQLAADKALAAKSKIDLSAAVKNFEDELNQLKQAYADARAKIDSGEDLEAGFEALQNDVFEAAGNVAQAHAAVQQLRRLTMTLTTITREIANEQRGLDRLKKTGKDTSDAQQILDEGKAKADEIKAVASAQPIDTSSLTDLLDELADIRERFQEVMNELRGVHEEDEIDRGIRAPSFQIPKLDFGSMGGDR